MSKNLFLSTLLSLTALTSIFTALAPVSAQAQVKESFFIAGSTKGLNMRNKDCSVMEVLSFGTMLVALRGPEVVQNITCNVGGVSQKMIYVHNFLQGMTNEPGAGDGYVAEKFVILLNSGNWKFQGRGEVTASAGLNVRDKDCRRVTTIPYRGVISIAGSYVSNAPVCQVGNQYYMMVGVKYNDKVHYMANSYLKDVN